MIRYENHAFSDFVSGNRFQQCGRLVQGMPFYVGSENHLAVQDQSQCSRILLRRTTPVTASSGIESHEVGESQVHFLGRETDHSQVPSVIKQPEGDGLTGWRATRLKYLQPDALATRLLREGTHRGFQFFLVDGTGVQGQGCAVLGNHVEPGPVDVNRHNCGAEGSGDLHTESAHTSHANKHSNVVGPKSRPPYRFIWGSDSVGYDGQKIEGNAERQMFGYGTKPSCGNTNMSRKASVAVVARHELPSADRGPTSPARSTVSAGNHGRNDYVATLPLADTLTCRHDAARDFVPESEW